MDARVRRLVMPEHPKMTEAVHDVDPNRTLYADKLSTDERMDRKVFEAKALPDVFKELEPHVDINVEMPQGETVNDRVQFTGLADFEQENVILRSRGLEALSNRTDSIATLKEAMQTNQRWRELLDNPEKRAQMLAYLEWIVAAVESVEKK